MKGIRGIVYEGLLAVKCGRLTEIIAGVHTGDNTHAESLQLSLEAFVAVGEDIEPIFS